MEKKKLRIFYLPGPVDAVSVYKHWVVGKDDPYHFAVIYVQQFYDVCKSLEAKGYVLSARDETKSIRNDDFIIKYRPVPFLNGPAFLFHLGQLWLGLEIIVRAIWFRANVVVVTQDRAHWFVLSLLPLLGIKVIPTLHCTLWKKYESPSKFLRLIHTLNRHFFIHSCSSILAISEDIIEQLDELTAGRHKPVTRFLPTYRPERFIGIRAPNWHNSTFRVLFVGRIEVNKGVYTLLDIAKRFAEIGEKNICFDICGTGSKLTALQLSVKEAGLEDVFYCHGYCQQNKLQKMYSSSHIVIVPTTSQFIEGFNKVVVESILSGRPVITSPVCNDLSYFEEAVVTVAPNDTDGYANAIIRLKKDNNFYETKRQSALKIQEKFYDYRNSWGAKVKQVIVKNVT